MTEERVDYFIDVIIPVAIPQFFTYRVPVNWNEYIIVGQRVLVNFGKNKLYAAIVSKIHQNPPRMYEAKYIEEIIDETPIVTQNQLKIWDWIADYYFCNIGDVMLAALPNYLKLSSETRIILCNQFDGTTEFLTEKDLELIDFLSLKTIITWEEACNVFGKKSIHKDINKLIALKAIEVFEEIKDKYKTLKIKVISGGELLKDENQLKNIFTELEKKAFKQLEVLMAILEIAKQKKQEKFNFYITKEEINKKFDKSIDAVLKALEEKQIISISEQDKSRLSLDNLKTNIPLPTLSEAQNIAFESINKGFHDNKVTFLHGVTSSGKTEIYIHLINQTLQNKKQVLFLVPEIGLTTQLVMRIKQYFGDRVAVYHSKFNNSERYEIWDGVLNYKSGDNNFSIILGARSSIFLPFKDLGLVIVDEEHDSSYKQFDPAPRYNARDTSIFLANQFNANVVLGSATPSAETYFNAITKKYHYHHITERFGGVELPQIELIDLKKQAKTNFLPEYISKTLHDEILATLEKGKKVILFQNRRGYAPFIQCSKCGWIPECNSCDVSLTYHKYINKLKCHYCGKGQSNYNECPACGSHELKMRGLGTEKIEDELNLIYSKYNIARMDLETTKGKDAYQKIIDDFENDKIDILIGTQMVAKGLDFEKVALVAILDADTMLYYPDFRAFERAFQLFVQVSGRAGRRNEKGKVLIQTYQSNHDVLQKVILSDSISMMNNVLADRKQFKYPPYFRLINITLKHKNIDTLKQASEILGNELKKALGDRILGPKAPSISRVKDKFLMEILVKIEKNASPSQIKKIIRDNLGSLYQKGFSSVRVVVDVDP
jgi:primosomal protein N' (replication factor Y) (superfamily II helicase)